jgi:hypothetical protein
MLETLVWIGFGASLIPAHRAAYEASRGVLVALLGVELIALAMCVVAGVSEPAWAAIAQEDGPVEWATFVSFVAAAGVLLVVVRKSSPSWWFKGACVLLALFCLAVAGEEISWGQRLFGFKPPDVFLERNFQQELNLHNVLMDERGLGFKLESKHLVMAIVIGFCGAWPYIVRRQRFAIFKPLAPPFALAPLAIGVVAVQMAYNVELTGEGAELIAGMIFLASALVATDMRPRTIAIWIAVPVIAGLILSTLMARIIFGSDEDGTRVATAEIALLQEDVIAGATNKLKGKRSVHKRVFTSARDGYLALSHGKFLSGRVTPADPKAQDPRHDRFGYFLDPWNNPYWIHFNKKTGKGALYSFGPNRRRDVTIRNLSSDPGDDIVVRFSLDGSSTSDDDTPDVSQ